MSKQCPCATDDGASKYAIDAAGQKVAAGDYVMASLPNVPATKRPRILHPCQVLQVQPAHVRLVYAGTDNRCRRWAREPFLRWHNEVVRVDTSVLGLEASGSSGADSCQPACCACRYREEGRDGD